MKSFKRFRYSYLMTNASCLPEEMAERMRAYREQIHDGPVVVSVFYYCYSNEEKNHFKKQLLKGLQQRPNILDAYIANDIEPDRVMRENYKNLKYLFYMIDVFGKINRNDIEIWNKKIEKTSIENLTMKKPDVCAFVCGRDLTENELARLSEIFDVVVSRRAAERMAA